MAVPRIALLLCTGLKHATNKISIWIGTAIAIAFLSHSVWDKYTSLPILNEFLKLFVGNEEAGVMFPIFPWAAYPIAGMAFGRFLKQQNKGTLNFIWCLKLGVVCVILGTGLTLTNPEYHIVTNLRSGPGIVLLMTGIVMLFIYTTHILVERFKQNYVVTLFAFWGKNVTALYVLQWILIGWGLMLVGLQQLTMTYTLVAMIVVLTACHYLVLPWHEYKSKSSKASKPHVSAVPLKP